MHDPRESRWAKPFRWLIWSVATLDFLAAGGSGYDMLKSVPLIKKIGIVVGSCTSPWSPSHGP